jgi:hypothetical protein
MMTLNSCGVFLPAVTLSKAMFILDLVNESKIIACFVSTNPSFSLSKARKFTER